MYTLENANRFIAEYLKSPWLLDNQSLAMIELWQETLTDKLNQYDALRLHCKSSYQYNAYSVGINQYRTIVGDLHECVKADKLAKQFQPTKDENYHMVISQALAY